MDKLYGVINFSWDSHEGNFNDMFYNEIFNQCFVPSPFGKSFKFKTQCQPTRDLALAKVNAFDLKKYNEYEQRLSRSYDYRWKKRVLVKEIEVDGYMKITPTMIKKAVIIVTKNHPNLIEKVSDEYKKYIPKI